MKEALEKADHFSKYFTVFSSVPEEKINIRLGKLMIYFELS